MDTIIEAPEPVEGNEEPAVQPETAETVSEGEGQPEEVQAPVEEPTVEFQGQKLTSAQLQEALEALKNKSEWQKANTQKSQEISEMRRQFEKEQQELLFLKQRLDQNPQLLQQMFAPQQARNFESELRELYNRRPDPYSQEYLQWELQKDALNREIARQEALRESQSMLVQTNAQEKNLSIERSAKEKYKGKVSEDEFLDMAKWIVQNVQPRNGVYPENAFDIAYRNTYMDKEIEAIKLEVSKKTTESMTKARPSSEAGLQKPYDKLTPEEQEDLEFVQRINMGKRK